MITSISVTKPTMPTLPTIPTMPTVKTLPNINMTSTNVTTTTYRSFLGKLFGKKCPQTKVKQKQNKAKGIYGTIDNPVRFKRGKGIPISDVTEPYKKSTLPIIMDTTTSTKNGKKHLGYADIQSKTTMTAISPKMSKKRGKFRNFLIKMLHKKKNEKQKRDALINLHREIRFSPFKKLKEMFQASSSSSKKPLPKSKDNSSFTGVKKALFNTEKNVAETEKELPDIFENYLPKEEKLTTKFNYENKNIFPIEDFGGLKLEKNLKQKKLKKQKDILNSDSIFNEFVTNYPTLKHDPIHFKTEGYFEKIKPKNEKLSYNKYRNKIHQLMTDNNINNDFTLNLKLDTSKLAPNFTPFTQFNYDKRIYSSDRWDPSAIFDPNTKETNAIFDLNTKNNKFETSRKYGQTNIYDVYNKEVSKYSNSDNNESRKLESMNSGYSITSNPLWQLKHFNDVDNILDKSRVHSKADTGKLNIKLSLRSKTPAFNITCLRRV